MICFNHTSELIELIEFIDDNIPVVFVEGIDTTDDIRCKLIKALPGVDGEEKSLLDNALELLDLLEYHEGKHLRFKGRIC
jgi:hypothetical protein